MTTQPRKTISLVLMACLSFYLVIAPTPTYAMHIAEGFLPLQWAIFGWIVALPFFLVGTYITTSIQLALAFPAATGGFVASFLKFAGIFAVTQIPLAISEGLLTVLVWNWLQSYCQGELEMLKLLRQEG